MLSVVVPTFNRAPVLKRCLEALEREDPDEVVVVDDGSTDTTPELLAELDWVRAVRIEHSGRAAAKNAGIAAANGDLLLFLDDDVLATPGLVALHASHHAAYPEPHEALLGRVTWSPELEITPHMRWLERGGPLFAFDRISDPARAPWRMLCSANVSLKRDYIEPFDPALSIHEDTDLGYRLSRRGLRLRYRPDALGHHLRAETPARTARRMREVGRAEALLHAKWPELREPPPRMRAIGRVKAAAAAALSGLGYHGLDDRLDGWRAAGAFARGYAEASREGAWRASLS